RASARVDRGEARGIGRRMREEAIVQERPCRNKIRCPAPGAEGAVPLLAVHEAHAMDVRAGLLDDRLQETDEMAPEAEHGRFVEELGRVFDEAFESTIPSLMRSAPQRSGRAGRPGRREGERHVERRGVYGRVDRRESGAAEV